MNKYSSEVLDTFGKGDNDLQMDSENASKEVDEAVLQQFESNVNSDVHSTVQDVDVMNVSFGASVIPDLNPNLENIDSQISSDNNQLNVASEIERLHSAISDSVTNNTNDEVDDVTNKMEWATITDDTRSTDTETPNPADNFLEGLRSENIEPNVSPDNSESPTLDEAGISRPTLQTEENRTEEEVLPEFSSAAEVKLDNTIDVGSKLDVNESEKSESDIVSSDLSELESATKDIANISLENTESTPNCSNSEPDLGEQKTNEPQTLETHSEKRNEDKDPHIEEPTEEDSMHEGKSQENTECVEKISDISNDPDKETTEISDQEKETTETNVQEEGTTESGVHAETTETNIQDEETSETNDQDKETTKINDQDMETTKTNDPDKETTKTDDQDKETTKTYDEDKETTKTYDQDKETTKTYDQDKETTKTYDQDKETTNTNIPDKATTKTHDQDKKTTKRKSTLKEVRFSVDENIVQSSARTNKKFTARENENTEFVQVNAADKEDESQNKNAMEQDPISADTSELPDNFESSDNREGADAELIIIPDTQREISQAEKEAACSIPPLKDLTETSASVDEGSGEGTQASGSQIVVYKYDKEDLQTCNECKLQRKIKYYYSLENVVQNLCDDNCLNTFKNRQNDKVALNWEEGSLRVKNFVGVGKEPPSLTFIRKCALCKKITDNIEINLTWEIMDFCDELCLSKYQKEIGSRCSSCQTEVKSNSLGKYCVRFGNDIRQFCTSTCLEKYKKGLKVCSYCQQDMSTGPKGFLAPVGDKGQFKDFCSQLCMDKYDIMTNDKPPTVPPGTICSVCKGEKSITIEFEHDGIHNHFCGEPCFVAFSFVNNISAGKCAMCRRHFPKSTLEKYTMYYDNVQYSFCSNSCENIYIIAHRKIVPCNWCKVKKYNFDMIRRYSREGNVINTCSINCLSFYRVSVRVTSSRQTHCDYCRKFTHPMYYLTMSNATVKDFCSYNCVMTFQSQFPKQRFAMNDDNSYPVPTGAPRKNKGYMGLENATPITDVSQLPVISSVQSLATNGNLGPPKGLVPPSLTPITTRTTRSKSAGAGALNSSPQVINSFGDLPFQVQIKQHFIVRPASMPEQKNAATMCYTRKMNKSITCKPEMVDQEVQTDEREASKILIPIPIPIFVPTPMHMFSVPTPTPVPFPVPIPIPVFIPTTRNSSAGIMKEMKKIMVKIPTDPYEAEILMMAEMVAEEKKEDITDSESDVDDTAGPEDSYSPEPVDASNAFGDDMLQMALKMATELDEPAVDLEGALTANTITAPQGSEPHSQEEAVDDPQQSMHHHMLERNPSARGRKRGMRQSRGGAKRGRRMPQHQVDLAMMQPQAAQPTPQPEPQEKPDANMCLKYTFGVNAWKQWVTTKNAELEKSSRVMPEFLFKTEILQLTSDELNYSLCLFVKEVRKPNGAEYAPDTIYYLCLGIQQYLFENGRIDNIFCDTYYEKFTDCLDEVAKKFSVLYNDSHYIVTRVEEEHLWESKQLGAHSPHVLLSTLMFFNTKHFNLTSVDEHMQLSFSHIMKHWKRNPNQPGASKVAGSRNVLLRFYPPQSAIQNNARKKKVYEQQENEENPLRCPVKLYEFYLSKCPESVKTRNDVFYLQPERSCVPDSPVWYSTAALPREALEKMLHRVKMVKEINVALLTS